MASEIQFVRVPTFERARRKILDDAHIRDVEEKLALKPDLGDLIIGTGGARKIRQLGAAGAARVIYYFHAGVGRIYFLACYAKNRKKDLTAAEKADLRALTKAIKDALKGR